MKLELQTLPTTANFCWLPTYTAPVEYQASTWVHLLEAPSTYSYDEALLICQQSEDEWLAWVPDHGEVTLRTRQFCSQV